MSKRLILNEKTGIISFSETIPNGHVPVGIMADGRITGLGKPVHIIDDGGYWLFVEGDEEPLDTENGLFPQSGATVGVLWIDTEGDSLKLEVGCEAETYPPDPIAEIRIGIPEEEFNLPGLMFVVDCYRKDIIEKGGEQ